MDESAVAFTRLSFSSIKSPRVSSPRVICLAMSVAMSTAPCGCGNFFNLSCGSGPAKHDPCERAAVLYHHNGHLDCHLAVQKFCQTCRLVGRHVDAGLLPIVDTDVSIGCWRRPTNAIRIGRSRTERCAKRVRNRTTLTLPLLSVVYGGRPQRVAGADGALRPRMAADGIGDDLSLGFPNTKVTDDEVCSDLSTAGTTWSMQP